MKTRLLFSTLFLFVFSFFSIAQDCPTFPKCQKIKPYLTIEPITLDDNGTGCNYAVRINGLDAFDAECFSFNFNVIPVITGTPPPGVQQSNDPFTFNVNLNHPNNAPVAYRIIAVVGVDGLPACTWSLGETVEMRCCIDDGETGVDLFSNYLECFWEDGIEKCRYNLEADINNLTGVDISWSVTSRCKTTYTGSGNSIDLVMESCDYPSRVTLTLVDEFGCEYIEEVEVSCFGCEPPPPCDDAPPVEAKVELVQTQCVQCPYTGIYFCRYNFTVLNPQAGYSYAWYYESNSGLSGGSLPGASASTNITSADAYTVTLVIIDQDNNCIIATQEYDIACGGNEEDCEVAECGNPELVDLVINIEQTAQECKCDRNDAGYVIGTATNCEFNITTNAPANTTAIMEIYYSESPGSPEVFPVGNSFNQTRSCGTGTLQMETCGATFCITLYDNDACVVGAACETIACDPFPCFEVCNGGEPFSGGESNERRASNNHVYPNPINLSISNVITLGGMEEQSATNIQLVNLSGTVVKEISVRRDWNREISLVGLTSGIYFLKLSNGTKLLQVNKIVVMD